MVSSLAEQLTIRVAPSLAASILGGTGDHTSSQISADTTRASIDDAANKSPGPKGIISPSNRISRAVSGP